ncbi:MAG TPA: hypothetical protein VKB08_13620 [Bradyrhizobium sp.]|nr:hypothetical protein [Bradyrhizobium sp.]
MLRLPAEELEKTGTLTAGPPCLSADALKFALLFAQGIFVTFDLLGTRRVRGAAIHGCKLTFQPCADRILRRRL